MGKPRCLLEVNFGNLFFIFVSITIQQVAYLGNVWSSLDKEESLACQITSNVKKR